MPGLWDGPTTSFRARGPDPIQTSTGGGRFLIDSVSTTAGAFLLIVASFACSWSLFSSS